MRLAVLTTESKPTYSQVAVPRTYHAELFAVEQLVDITPSGSRADGCGSLIVRDINLVHAFQIDSQALSVPHRQSHAHLTAGKL